MKIELKRQKRYRRHKRVRAKVFGTARCPRLCVFRSSKHIYAQLIDDDKARTILSSNEFELKKSKVKSPCLAGRREKSKPQGKSEKLKEKKEEAVKTTKVAVAYEVGKLIAQKALARKIKKVVFDRGGYKYHGRVKAIAEGARSAGLEF